MAADIDSMLATLAMLDGWLGPYHPRTLRLMADVAEACWQAGMRGYARPLLERTVRDLGRFLAQDVDLRLRAMASLGDLLAADGEHERAASLRTELRDWQQRRRMAQ